MTPEERDLITGLFDRLRRADTAGPKDREAEQLISRRVDEQPAAPYLLVQTLLVQEHALNNAQTRIAQLERQVADAARQQPAAEEQGGSFLGGLLRRATGGGSSAPSSPPAPQRAAGGAVPVNYAQGQGQPQPVGSAPAMMPPQAAPGYPSTTNMPPSAGGGFLSSALTTAAGVAGGALLFQGVQNLMGHNAGAFGPALGAAGHAGSAFQGGGGPTEVVNNYYGDSAGGGGHGQAGDLQPASNADDFNSRFGGEGTVGEQGSALQDASFTDQFPEESNADFDPGAGVDDGGGDDSSYV